MRAADAVVQLLARSGVRFGFTVPGESFLALMDALHESPIRLIPTRHESGASFMAEATSRISHRLALCMATRAPGAANLAIGLHTALHDSTPIIAIVGQVRRDMRFRDSFQEVDLAHFISPVTKWSVEVANGDQLLVAVSEAIRLAQTGRPGPTAVIVPEDVFEDQVGQLPAEPTTLSQAGLSDDVLRSVGEMLASAKRPVILAGGGVVASAATDLLVDLAETTGTPVVTAFRRHDAYPNDHPNYVGSLSLGAPRITRQVVQQADLVLALGTRLNELTTRRYRLIPEKAALIHIDVSAEELGRNFATLVPLVADAGSFLGSILKVLRGRGVNSTNMEARRAVLAGARNEYLQATDPVRNEVHAGTANPALITRVASQLTLDGVITCDAGNFAAWVSRYLIRTRSDTFFGPTSGAMGYGLPAGVAASLVVGPERPTVVMAGDGGFMMTASELATAQMLKSRLCCIVFDNARYATIQMHQEREYPGRRIATDLDSPDFESLAKAYRARFFRLEDDNAIDRTLGEAIGHSGLSVVHVPMQTPPYLPADV